MRQRILCLSFATQAQEDAYINNNTAPSPEDYGDGWQGVYDSTDRHHNAQFHG